MVFILKRFLCIFCSAVIVFSFFCFSVAAEEPPKGYEIGECVFDDDDFKSFMEAYIAKYPNKGIIVDEDGYYTISDDYPNVTVNLKGFLPNANSKFYYVEFVLGSADCLQLKQTPELYPDLTGNKYPYYSGSGSAFTTYDSSIPKITLNPSSYRPGYKVKTIRFYELNISGSAGLKNVGTSFGFMVNGIGNVIKGVFENSVLMLGIALFCCGCAVAVYYRLRS